MISEPELPVHLDMKAYRGDRFERSVELEFKHEDGSPGILQTAGYTGKLQVRDTKDTATVRASAAVVCGELDTLGGNGRVRIAIPAATMQLFPDGYVGFYDLELVDPSSRPKTVIEGAFLVNGDVSR